MSSMVLEIVTPEGSKVSEESVGYVSLPGTEGVLGVMGGHMNFVTSLKPGAVVFADDSAMQNGSKLVVSSGIAEITHDRCVVLVERAMAMSDVKLADLEDSLAKCKHDLSKEENKTTIENLQGEIAFLETAMELLRSST